MLTLVAQISLQDVVDAFLRAQTEKLGQSEMGRRIGTARQGVNAIINRREGRRFTFEHLERFASSSGIMTSALLAELANLAWRRESELKPTKQLPPPVIHGEDDARKPASAAELLDLLTELLEERRRRQP